MKHTIAAALLIASALLLPNAGIAQDAHRSVQPIPQETVERLARDLDELAAAWQEFVKEQQELPPEERMACEEMLEAAAKHGLPMSCTE